MNFHAPNIDREPTAMEAADALATLRAWAKTAEPADVAALEPALGHLMPGSVPDYPALARAYPDEFVVDAASMSVFQTFACRCASRPGAAPR